MRKLFLLMVPVLALSLALVGSTPAGAVGVGTNNSVISPNLDNGFPCNGGGAGGLFSFQKYLAGAAGLPVSACTGSIYSGSVANFAGAGTVGSTAYAVAGTGSLSGSYLYSEPCQVTTAGNDPLTGEAYGAPNVPDLNGGLTLNIPTAVGVVGTTAISSAKVSVSFWWSRVGVTAIVGIKNIRATFQPGNIAVNDAAASGLAAAVFIPVNQPSCDGGVHPTHPGDINIASGTLTAGTA